MESDVLFRALRDFNIPKILSQDMVIFTGLLQDLFPGVNPPRKRDIDFEKARCLHEQPTACTWLPPLTAASQAYCIPGVTSLQLHAQQAGSRSSSSAMAGSMSVTPAACCRSSIQTDFKKMGCLSHQANQ